MNNKSTITIYIMWFASLALCFVVQSKDAWWAIAHLILCTALVVVNGVLGWKEAKDLDRAVEDYIDSIADQVEAEYKNNNK